MRKSVLFAIGLGVFSAGLGVGAHVIKAIQGEPIKNGRELTTSKPLGNFSLTNTDGASIDKNAFLGKWTVLAFGFTHCPDICPATLSYFKKELLLLEYERDDIQFAFVSLDPERDSLEKLKSYVSYYSPAIKAYTGTSANLEKLAQNLGFYFERTPSKDGLSYSITHSPYFFLINPEGEWQAVYSPPLIRGHVATDLARLVHQKKSFL